MVKVRGYARGTEPPTSQLLAPVLMLSLSTSNTMKSTPECTILWEKIRKMPHYYYYYYYYYLCARGLWVIDRPSPAEHPHGPHLNTAVWLNVLYRELFCLLASGGIATHAALVAHSPVKSWTFSVNFRHSSWADNISRVTNTNKRKRRAKFEGELTRGSTEANT